MARAVSSPTSWRTRTTLPDSHPPRYMRGPRDRGGSFSHRMRPDAVSTNSVAASMVARSANGGVAGVGEVEAAAITGEIHLHAVHHVAEGQPGFRIGPTGGTAGPEMAERTGRRRHQLGRDRESESELLVHVEQHMIGARCQARRRPRQLLVVHQPYAVDLTDAGRVHPRERPGITDAVDGG